jgi:hypothetical protein
VSKLVLETDCAGTVAKLKNAEMDRSIHGPLVEEIKKMLRHFDASSIEHVQRHNNEVAHRLAKRGCSNKMSELDGMHTRLCTELVVSGHCEVIKCSPCLF